MHSDDPYVSIVIPTYNRAALVGAAVTSVLEQRDTPWSYEIIVVDDGSTDGTERALRPFADAISYRRIEHSGRPAAARNVGIALARGELVAFLDSDDLWTADKLATQVPAFDDPRIVLSYGQARKFYGDDPTPREPVVEATRLRRGEDFSSLLKENVVSTLTAVARRSALNSVGAFDESPDLRGVEDYELWLRLAARYPGGIVSTQQVVALYRVHEAGLGTSDSLRAIGRLNDVYESVWRCDYLTRGQREALEEQYLQMHENWSRQNSIDGQVPTVSVVMSIYRDRPFVAQAVQSILDQTFDDFELIVVDDGSDDGSYDVVAGFSDPRLRIIRQTNRGLVGALNTGVRVARAPLIARQDADDVSLPNRLEREVAYMSARPRCTVVGTFFRYVDERTLEPTGTTITSVTKHLDIVRCMYFDNPIGHGTALVRRAAILEIGGYSDAFGPNEDYDLWRRLVAAGGRMGIIPEVHYLYRVNSSGISSTSQELQHRLFAELLETVWRGRIHFKGVVQIVADGRYYRRLDSPFRDTVHRQYTSNQLRLTVEFLGRRHFYTGLHTLAGSLLIAPIETARLAIALVAAYARAASRRVARIAGRR